MDGDGFLFDTGSNPISRVEEQLNEVELMFTELCARVNERDKAICNDVVKHILSLLQLQYLSRTSLPRYYLFHDIKYLGSSLTKLGIM